MNLYEMHQPELFHAPVLAPQNDPAVLPDPTVALTDNLIRLLATSYVRREGRFYHIDRPSVSLTRDDLQRSFLTQAYQINNGAPFNNSIKKEIFETAIQQNNPDPTRSIPVWTGTTVSYPGNPNRRIQLESGQVILNSWKAPDYRTLPVNSPPADIFGLFLGIIFPRPDEHRRVLDWLAWCLQNEDKKPNWAVMLYSREKGTGKSTFCSIATRLFGLENTSVENNVEKLSARFNGPILNKKLVICEEVNLRPESTVGNKLKTLITEHYTTAERKGKDVEQVKLHSCFLMTSNHLPLWIEPGERRYYILDVSHDGHASGPHANDFAEIVGEVERALANDTQVAALYQTLMHRQLAEDFDPMSLNVKVHGTEVMQRVQANQTAATTQQLAEFLGRENCVAIAEQDLRAYVTKEMRQSANSLRHMMTNLDWTRHKVKWGAKDYARALWTAPKYVVDRGDILGPQGFKKAICDVLWDAGEA